MSTTFKKCDLFTEYNRNRKYTFTTFDSRITSTLSYKLNVSTSLIDS